MAIMSDGSNERREHLRLTGCGPIPSAMVVDERRNPIVPLRNPEVTNVSAGGLALTSESSVPTGSHVLVEVDAQGKVAGEACEVEALSCTPWVDSRFVIRFRLIAGRIPAALLNQQGHSAA